MENNGVFDLSKKEIGLFKKLNSPSKIQGFLNSLKINFEEEGDTCFSPRRVLQEKRCHCVEGAVLAAMVLRFYGREPVLVDLTSSAKDFDHVLAVFKQHGMFGAISKTNHAVLRYREPVYKNIRELVMSYFHEYFLNKNGKKTLRRYSRPLDLSIFGKNWAVAENDPWYIDNKLDKIKHYDIMPKVISQNLRKAEKIEIEAGKIVEYIK